jgi:hypothetical protein
VEASAASHHLMKASAASRSEKRQGERSEPRDMSKRERVEYGGERGKEGRGEEEGGWGGGRGGDRGEEV